MANTDYLADTLTNPKVTTKRNVPVFQDNRPKTPTPYPFIETILPGKKAARGRIGVFEGSSWVPEPNAYIYVYINGFLVNPPIINPDGTYKNTETAIISNNKGEWETPINFFSVLPQFEYGQAIAFRGKAPLKKISDISVPYAVGATPAPIDMGIIGDMGELRAPYDGEYYITGRMSYWFNNNPVGEKDRGAPNFDCDNHVYVYIDGVHAGSYTNVLGEIFRNEVRGTNADYPLAESLNKKTLMLDINDQPVSIPLKSLFPSDSSPLFGVIDGTNSDFWFVLPDASATIKVYRNGVRQADNIDYTYSIDSATKRGVVSFKTWSIPQAGDDLLVNFLYNFSEFMTGEVPTKVDSTTLRLSNKARSQTVEVYKNGIHLKLGNDYTYDGYSSITLTTAMEADDAFLVDYQKVTATPSLVEVLDYRTFYAPDPNNPNTYVWSVVIESTGKPNIYKNGLRLKEGIILPSESKSDPIRVTNDYVVVEPNFIIFSPWSVPTNEDILVAVFYHAPISLTQLVSYLNDTEEFAKHCLTASTVGAEVLPDWVVLEGLKNNQNTSFALPKSNLAVNYKVFKNGLRQKEILKNSEDGDYTINYVDDKFVFSRPPSPRDALSTVLSYITTSYIVGEVPVGDIDGINNRFTLSMLPQESTVSVYVNGLRLNPHGQYSDYMIENGRTIRLVSYVPSPGDIILVDYEPAYSRNTFTSSMLIPVNSDPSISVRTYTFSSPLKNVAVHVYINGVLQSPKQDYNLSVGGDSITFTHPTTAPKAGDIFIIELVQAELFKLNPKDQLKIISPNKLDIHRYGTEGQMDSVQNMLFGDDVTLYPGRDDDGEFYFWFNRNTGYWKWSWINPVTKEITYFKTGQRITARAWNKSMFSYKVIR